MGLSTSERQLREEMNTFSPVFLEQVRQLAALVTQRVGGNRAGQHRSHRVGGGTEFADHRPYVPGDDARYLDTKVLARTGRYLVKRFHNDRRCDVELVLDLSGSMGFGSTEGLPEADWGPWPATKWQLSAMLGLAIAGIFLAQGDRVGIRVASGQGVAVLPRRGGRDRLAQMVQWLDSQAPTGVANLEVALAGLREGTRPDLVVAVSDLLAADEGSEVRALQAAGEVEAWLVHVIDPAEQDFPYEEPGRFICLEGGGELSLNPRELATEYRREFAAFLERSRVASLEAGVRYQRARSDQDPVAVLAQLLVR